MAMKLVAVILSLCVCQIHTWFNPIKHGSLGPPDAKACTTQNVTFNCTLTKTDTYTSSDLELKMLIDTENYTIVENSDMTIVDNRTVLYTMEHLTSEDHGTNIECIIHDSDTIVGDPLFLQVYDFPKEVENIRCVVRDYDKDMNCSWTVPFKHPNVTSRWRITGFSFWTEFTSSEITFSYISSTRDGDFSMKNIQVNVTVKSDCGLNVTSVYDINTRNIVKPNPVDVLRSNTINSTCVRVTWKPNAKQYEKRYHISYTSKWGHSEEIPTIMDTDANRNETKNITVCDLVPYTQYTFTVKVHPYHEGYWSDERQTTATTSESIPMSPEVTKGGYRLKDPQQCKSDKYRDVVVYWKVLEEINKNGKIISMDVIYTSSSATKERSVVSDATHTSEMLLCDTAYNVSVQARTKAGTSEVESTINIPAVSSSGNFALVDVFVEMYQNDSQKDDVYIEWKPPATADAKYTVFWCDEVQGECMDGSLNWTTVLGTNTSLTMKMEWAEYKLFGVSMETADGSNGLSWTSCIYTKDANPTKAPTNVNVKEGNEDNTLSVTWNKIECQSGQPFIAYYNITFYDVAKGKGDMKSLKVPSDVNTATLTDLNADVKYAVQVKGETRSGSDGPLSKTAFGTPIDNSLKAGDIAAITAGGFFCLMFIAAGVWFIFRCCINRLKNKLKGPDITDVPINGEDGYHDNTKNAAVEIDEKEWTTPPYISQLSNDSGMFDSPMTPTNNDDKGFQGLSHINLIPDDYVQFTKDSGNDNPGCDDVSLNPNGTDVLLVHQPNESIIFGIKREPPLSNGDLFRSVSSEPFFDKQKEQGLNKTVIKAGIDLNGSSAGEQVLNTDGSVVSYVKVTQEQSDNVLDHENQHKDHDNIQSAEAVHDCDQSTRDSAYLNVQTGHSLHQNPGDSFSGKAFAKVIPCPVLDTDVDDKDDTDAVAAADDDHDIGYIMSTVAIEPGCVVLPEDGNLTNDDQLTNASNNGFVSTANMQSSALKPNTDANTSKNDYISAVDMQSLSGPNTDANTSNNGYVSTANMQSLSSPNTDANIINNDYVSSVDMQSLLGPNTDANTSNNGYVSIANMQSLSGPNTDANIINNDYVSSVDMQSLSGQNTEANTSNNDYVSTVDMQSLSGPNTDANTSNNGYVSTANMQSLSGPNTDANIINNDNVSSVDMRSLSGPNTDANTINNDYVSTVDMQSLSGPNTDANTINNDYVSTVDMQSLSGPNTDSNTSNNDYVSTVDMQSLSNPNTDANTITNDYVSTDNMQPSASKPTTDANTATLDYVLTTGFSPVLQPNNGSQNDPTNLGMLSPQSPDYVTTVMSTVDTTKVFQPNNSTPVNNDGLNPVFCEDANIEGSHTSGRSSCSDDSGHGSLGQGSPGSISSNGYVLSTQLSKPFIFPSEPIPEVGVNNDGNVSHKDNKTPSNPKNLVSNNQGYMLHSAINNITPTWSPGNPQKSVPNDQAYVSHAITDYNDRSNLQNSRLNDPGFVFHSTTISPPIVHGGPTLNTVGYVQTTQL